MSDEFSLSEIISQIETELATIEIDEIVARLGPMRQGFVIECPIFNPGSFLYRGRKLPFGPKEKMRLADLSHPMPEIARPGRVNRAGKPMFYCSASKEVIFFELPNLSVGDELILSFWKTRSKMLLNNIGYTQHLFEKLGAKRQCPDWAANSKSNSPSQKSENFALTDVQFDEQSIRKVLSHDKNSAVRQALGSAFLKSVGPENPEDYKLTTAIAEMHLGEIVNSDLKFSGLLYPTVQMQANGDNIALFPEFVDQCLDFKKALHARVDCRDGHILSVSYLDAAIECTSDGTLKWLGRLPNWTVGPGKGAKAVATVGVDLHGDYSIGADGNPLHWVLTDIETGAVIDPA